MTRQRVNKITNSKISKQQWQHNKIARFSN